jgi:hypothetical protein
VVDSNKKATTRTMYAEFHKSGVAMLPPHWPRAEPADAAAAAAAAAAPSIRSLRLPRAPWHARAARGRRRPAPQFTYSNPKTVVKSHLAGLGLLRPFVTHTFAGLALGYSQKAAPEVERLFPFQFTIFVLCFDVFSATFHCFSAGAVLVITRAHTQGNRQRNKRTATTPKETTGTGMIHSS